MRLFNFGNDAKTSVEEEQRNAALIERVRRLDDNAFAKMHEDIETLREGFVMARARPNERPNKHTINKWKHESEAILTMRNKLIPSIKEQAKVFKDMIEFYAVLIDQGTSGPSHRINKIVEELTNYITHNPDKRAILEDVNHQANQAKKDMDNITTLIRNQKVKTTIQQGREYNKHMLEALNGFHLKIDLRNLKSCVDTLSTASITFDPSDGNSVANANSKHLRYLVEKNKPLFRQIIDLDNRFKILSNDQTKENLKHAGIHKKSKDGKNIISNIDALEAFFVKKLNILKRENDKFGKAGAKLHGFK